MKTCQQIAALTAASWLLHSVSSPAETPAEVLTGVVAEMCALQAAHSNANSGASTTQQETADTGSLPQGSGFRPLGNGPQGQDSTDLLLAISALGNGLLKFGVTNGAQYGSCDLYYVNSLQAQNWQWRRVYTGAQADGGGNATFTLQRPDPNQVFLSCWMPLTTMATAWATIRSAGTPRHPRRKS